MSELRYQECADCQVPLWEDEGSRCAHCTLDDSFAVGMTVALFLLAVLITTTLLTL